jgi:hypothetical protein
MLFNILFGCSHRRYTFPISTRPGQTKSAAAEVTGIYVVCLDCGKEFAYDWANMRVLSPKEAEQRQMEANEAALAS